MAVSMWLATQKNGAVKLIPLLFLFIPQRALSHGDFLYTPQTTVDGSIYLSAQNQGTSDNTLWQIPGVLMGGEAKGSESGFAINDANLGITWANQAGAFVLFSGSAHGHGSDIETTVEEAFGGYHWTHTRGHIKLEAGKMKGAFSLENPLHPSGREFTEASLPYQAFLGEHFSDIGARAQFMNWHGESGLSTYGAELWRGASFPANQSTDTPSWDVFARYQHTKGRLQLTGGGWYFRSDAENRQDDRNGDGHVHGALSPSSDIRFTGETELVGIEGSALWQQTPVLAYTIKGELIFHHSDGTLRDTSRLANAELKQQGASLLIGCRYLSHQLALQYSTLKTDNTLMGAGSTILGDNAGLNANHHRPERLSLAYQYSWSNGIAMRAELVDDDSSREALEIVRLSVFWDGTLWTK